MRTLPFHDVLCAPGAASQTATPSTTTAAIVGPSGTWTRSAGPVLISRRVRAQTSPGRMPVHCWTRTIARTTGAQCGRVFSTTSGGTASTRFVSRPPLPLRTALTSVSAAAFSAGTRPRVAAQAHRVWITPTSRLT